MKASLDTNVIIHLYRAKQEGLLFDLFKDRILIYEQIRKVELENHGRDILKYLDKDIMEGKIELCTDEKLKEFGVLKLFQEKVKENRYLYGSGDLGEVYAISLAQTLGAYFLVTDDIKQGGPYMSLLQFCDNDILPFTFVDIIILKFLSGAIDEINAIKIFDKINIASKLNWSFEAHLKRFIKRFWTNPYQKTEEEWIKIYCENNGIRPIDKIRRLRNIIRSSSGQ